MKYDVLQIMKVFWILISIFNVAIIIVVLYLFIEYRPLVTKLLNGHYQIRVETDLAVDTTIPLSASLDTEIAIPVDYDIPLSLPLKTVVNFPIDHTVTLDLDETIPVKVFHAFNLGQGLRLQTTLPIDTVVNTKLFGLDTELPIDVDVPLDASISLIEDIVLDETVPLHLSRPVPVRVTEDLQIPIDHVFEAVLPLQGNISLPLKIEASTELKVDKTVPCVIGIDMSFDEKED